MANIRVCVSPSAKKCFVDLPPFPQTCTGTYGRPGGGVGVCTVEWDQCSGTR